METDALIRGLAGELESQPRAWPLRLWLALAMIAAGALLLLAVVLGLGVRSDLGPALLRRPFLVKLGLGSLCALGGYLLATRLARPDAPDPPGRWLAIAVGVVALGLLAGAMQSGAALGAPLDCVVALVLLALAPLAAALAVLRRGASARPSATGAAAGMLAGGLSVLGYALYCPIDSLAYVAAWYGAGVLCTALLGGVLGRVALRW